MACSITSISPLSISPGSQLQVVGTGFGIFATGVSSLALVPTAGPPVPFTNINSSDWTDTLIKATVPVAANGSYQIQVTNGPLVSCTSAVSVTLNPPAITSLSPFSVSPGTQLTISGSGFGVYTPGASQLGLVPSTGPLIPFLNIAIWTEYQIQATVPSATNGNYRIQIINRALVVSTSTSSVTLTNPTTSGCSFSVAPQPAVWGANLLLTAGANSDFGAAGKVTIDLNGTSAQLAIAGWSNKNIVAILPSQGPAGDGTYMVVLHRLTDTCQLSLPITTIGALGTNPPAGELFAAAPNPATPGSRVLLISAGLGGFPTTPGTVTMMPAGGGATVSLIVLAWTLSEISVLLPATAIPGDFQITVSSGTSSGSGTLTIIASTISQFRPSLPSLPNDPLLSLFGDSSFLQNKSLLTDAIRTGNKWRYSHLKNETIRAAARLSEFEVQILSLMQMAQGKVQTAELLASPIFTTAIRLINQDTQSLIDLANTSDLQDVIKSVADASGQALLLEAIILWLVTHSPVQFWVGLFSALISDVASFDTGATGTKNYLSQQFNTGPFAAELQTLASQLLSRLDAEVDAMAAPLRAAVQSVVADTSTRVQDVFKASDVPLFMALPDSTGQPDIPNINPLATVTQQLVNAVEDLIDRIKTELQNLLQSPYPLFEKVMMAFLVLPILALVAIGLSGGPFSAAMLAAIVLLAAEELIHLVASWLSGPLLKELDKAKQKAIDTVAKMQAMLAKESALVEVNNPKDYLTLLASELRELKDLLPQVFLDAIAQLLGSARDVVLKRALLLAHGAEQALGAENATAFDMFAYRYITGLPQASQLPGGSDPALFAGAALLRDLGQLEQQRTAVLDGKELEVTQRLSVFELLGSDPGRFLEFLRNGRLIVNLSEEGLIDRRFPGLYRTLIKEVRMMGLFEGSAMLPPTISVPVMLTHLGPSSTRVKLKANPSAPPIAVPACLGTRANFIERMVQNAPPGARTLDQILIDADEYAKRHPPANLHFAMPIGYFPVSAWSQLNAYAAYVPDVLSQNVLLASCGIINPVPIAAAAKAILAQQVADMDFDDKHNVLANVFDHLPRPQWAIDELRSWVLSALRNGVDRHDDNRNVIGHIAGLDHTDPMHIGDRVLGDAYDRSLADLQQRIAKWGGATLRPDRDPHITALGYATLERNSDPEALAYNLLPTVSTSQANPVAAPASGVDGQPLDHPSTLQYRPFENKGLGGRFLLSLPGVDTATALGSTADIMGTPALPSAASVPLLQDVILEITYRGCYDKDLAAAVRASQSRRRDEFRLASGSLAPIVMIGAPIQPQMPELCTIHISLRAHRDRTLLAWKAAKQENTSVSLPVDPTTVNLLGVSQPLLPLTAGGNSVSISLLPSTLPSLTNLETTIPITLPHLGLPPTALQLPTAEQLLPQIVEIGFAVVPAGATVPAVTLGAATGLGAMVPLVGTTLRVLHTFANPSAVVPPPPTPVSITAFDAASLRLDMAGVTPTASAVYDVLISLSLRIPCLEALAI